MTFPKPPVREKRSPRPIARKGIARKPWPCVCVVERDVHSGLNCGPDTGRRKSARSSPLKRGTGKPARTKRPNKVRKTGRAKLKRLADKLAGQICRARGKCEACGAGPEAVLQWAHLFSRRYHAVRWNLLNCACLCKGCHFKYGLRPLEFDEWMRAILGLPAYDELRRIALKNERVDMEATVAYLRIELSKVSSQEPLA